MTRNCAFRDMIDNIRINKDTEERLAASGDEEAAVERFGVAWSPYDSHVGLSRDCGWSGASCCVYLRPWCLSAFMSSRLQRQAC